MFAVGLFLLSLVFGITAVLNYIAGQDVSWIHWAIGLPGLIVAIVALPFALMSNR
jgi:hypothetical protein